MKRQFALAMVAALVLGTLLVASCANPLESTPELVTPQGTDTLRLTDTLLLWDTLFVSDSLPCTDTVFLSDSVVYADTLFIVDTVREIDTVVVTDSVFRIDTVFVTMPDTSDCGRMCSQISSAQSQITWLLDNAAGLHRLDFAAQAERNKPAQTLILEVDGTAYEWTVQESSDYSVDVNLPDDATIRISVLQPKALGHSIAVCLTATPL